MFAVTNFAKFNVIGSRFEMTLDFMIYIQFDKKK